VVGSAEIRRLVRSSCPTSPGTWVVEIELDLIEPRSDDGYKLADTNAWSAGLLERASNSPFCALRTRCGVRIATS
jgi:hypothetical protein